MLSALRYRHLLAGEGQSGHIEAIGFSLYMGLLERAVEDLKVGKAPDLSFSNAIGTEMDLKICALIPDDYMPDVAQRLSLYKRIADASNKEELRELQVELIDRFGALPKPVETLLAVTQLKIKAQALGIRRVEANAKGGWLEFVERPSIDPECLIRLIREQATVYRLDGPQKLRFLRSSAPDEERLQLIETILDSLV